MVPDESKKATRRVARYADNQLFQGMGKSLDATGLFRCSTLASGLHG